MKLTMGTYTDETQIPPGDAIEKLPNILDLNPNPLTHLSTRGVDVSGRKLPQGVAIEA